MDAETEQSRVALYSPGGNTDASVLSVFFVFDAVSAIVFGHIQGIVSAPYHF
jgi:hypothetical protein